MDGWPSLMLLILVIPLYCDLFIIFPMCVAPFDPTFPDMYIYIYVLDAMHLGAAISGGICFFLLLLLPLSDLLFWCNGEGQKCRSAEVHLFGSWGEVLADIHWEGRFLQQRGSAWNFLSNMDFIAFSSLILLHCSDRSYQTSFPTWPRPALIGIICRPCSVDLAYVPVDVIGYSDGAVQRQSFSLYRQKGRKFCMFVDVLVGVCSAVDCMRLQSVWSPGLGVFDMHVKD